MGAGGSPLYLYVLYLESILKCFLYTLFKVVSNPFFVEKHN